VGDDGLEFYASPGPMTRLPDHPALANLPTDVDAIRSAVQGLILHRDWAPLYDVAAEDVRADEQHLRSTIQRLDRTFEISPEPIDVPRAPIDRTIGTCRDFTLVYVALLRAQGIPARARCGFSSYFDPAKWLDHWIAERWDGTRWVRDDAQVDDRQRELVNLDFDAHDQPKGKFLDGSEAWAVTRRGEVDPQRFGIFDMWGAQYISGNLVQDLAALNKVELLPWDSWGIIGSPHADMADEQIAAYDDLAALVIADDFTATRGRYLSDDRVRVPSTITTFRGGGLVEDQLDL
jgi:hypothetical protein